MKLLAKYGHCIIPANTKLYRMGEVDFERGAFFSLHPLWANNFLQETKQSVNSYILLEEIKLIFLINDMSNVGQPNTSIKELYEEIVGDLGQMNDLDVKWRNKTARAKLVAELKRRGINGWLSTQENKFPLEVFLLPKTCKLVEQTSCFRSAINSLKIISLYPSQNFIDASLYNMKVNKSFILEVERNYSEGTYSILHKVFIDTKLL